MQIHAKLQWACLLGLISLCNARGAVVLSGDITGSGGTFEITAPITFQITKTSSTYYFVFDNWVTNDGTTDPIFFTPNSSGYRINGGTLQNYADAYLVDNIDETAGDLSPDDGVIFMYNIAVTLGDTLTLESGIWSTTGSEDFNPDAIQTFTGNMFIVDNTLTAITPLTPVPEPTTTTAGLAALALGAAVIRRRRRNREAKDEQTEDGKSK